ncbi:MAG: metal-dependent hydrolase [Myxococcaceae bacterium]|nr:metal-dependent hydrolase [Myxococcaceae bacterium]
MASFGHIAVGLAAGRAFRPERPWWCMVGFSALSLLPDADVIAFVFRVPYEAPLGHRGATHSLVFAALCGLTALLARRDRRLALFTGLVVLSHPLLDMSTDGGLGCALFWPLSNERLFWPVRPLPVAPIGAGMLSTRGLSVVLTELLFFLPLVVAALWPPRRAAPP